jgi:hypothetical protein
MEHAEEIAVDVSADAAAPGTRCNECSGDVTRPDAFIERVYGPGPSIRYRHIECPK